MIRRAVSLARRSVRPRLGFLGVGWIGCHRMQALADSGIADVAVIADVHPESGHSAAAYAPGACVVRELDELLDYALDGVVIATPSALHAEQCIAALDSGVAVFCQKPLARTVDEARRVIHAARRVDRPLAVDLSYRHTRAMQQVRRLVRSGELGRVYAADLVFHNAYGPSKPWFYDRALAGGGCVIDLGIHLVDLALWLLAFPDVLSVDGRVYSEGEPMTAADGRVEDYATIQLDLAGDVSVRIACSWQLSAGRDAVIEAVLHGTSGGAAMRNVDGSFYDFTGEHYRGTTAEIVAAPPDAWGGRALVDWAARVARGDGFDPEVENLIRVHEVIDAVYRRGRDGEQTRCAGAGVL